MRKDDLKRYRKLLLERRTRLSSDMNHLQDEAMGDSTSGELSTMPFHMADRGTETYDKDFALGLIENGSEELEALDKALARIEAGTYGRCEECGCAIPKTRLSAIPQTSCCVQCQEKLERHRP